MTGAYHDDNFGAWTDTDDPGTRRFYREVQRESVEKECGGCGRTVRLRPQYGYCSACADAIERGMDVG